MEWKAVEAVQVKAAGEARWSWKKLDVNDGMKSSWGRQSLGHGEKMGWILKTLMRTMKWWEANAFQGETADTGEEKQQLYVLQTWGKEGAKSKQNGKL